MAFFKAYDMRGKFGVDFNLDTVYKVGKFLPQVVNGSSDKKLRVLVGRDARTTSCAIRDALVAGLVKSGAEVTDMGLTTTPMVYFFTAREDFDLSVQITASHNPPSDNGLKVSKQTALPVGYASGLSEVEKLVNSDTGDKYLPPVHVNDTMEVDEIRLTAYCDWMNQLNVDLSDLSFAVDCSDGMASILAYRIFGANAIYLNDKIDGTFPHHSPNPLLAETREQLVNTVRENRLDCGIIFDGDADRVMFVDENGTFIQPDFLIPILASTFDKNSQCYLPSQPADSKNAALPRDGDARFVVVHDVRTSRAVIEALAAMGAEPVIGKVGHAFAKVLLRETGAVCGGELAGHYYFRDFYGCDSAALAALRILHAFASAKKKGIKISKFMQPIMGKYANSGEVNFTVEDKEVAIERVLAKAATLAKEVSRTEIDGVRLEFAEGWISIRQSNTEPLLRLLIECDTEERMNEWLEALKASIEGK